jgi:c-di-GMP-binding flagellar brake protein YcgR
MNADSYEAQARQFARHEVAYDAVIEPHADHADQFCLSLPDAQSGLAVVDVSAGGVGLRSGIYVPRNMRMTLHVSGVGRSGEVLRIKAIARRCRMVDHKPTYLVGLQFADADGPDEQTLIRVTNTVMRRETESATAGASSGS